MTRCPGVPMQPFPLPLSPGREKLEMQVLREGLKPSAVPRSGNADPGQPLTRYIGLPSMPSGQAVIVKLQDEMNVKPHLAHTHSADTGGLSRNI